MTRALKCQTLGGATKTNTASIYKSVQWKLCIEASELSCAILDIVILTRYSDSRLLPTEYKSKDAKCMYIAIS